MLPAHIHPCGKQVLEQGKGSIIWSFFYRKNCTEQTGAGCISNMLRAETFNNNYYYNNNKTMIIQWGKAHLEQIVAALV